MTIRWKCACACSLLLAMAGLTVGPAAGDQPHGDAVAKAVAFLKSRQAKDGTWSQSNSPGITGLVLFALLRSGEVKPTDPAAERALKYIESMIDVKEGHLAGVPGGTEGKNKGKGGFHKNYITSVNLLALKASGLSKYDTVIAKATAYLKKLQWDEKLEKDAKDPFYGGVGYGPNTRPDMSNTMFFLDAMKAAEVPASDPLYKKAVVFISRCQNLKGEHNDQPWAGKINDGSFIYVLAQGKGKAKVEAPKDDKRPGYGSMTYAGLKMLNLCGLPKDDERFKKAFEWVSQHYTLDENPGRRELGGGREGAEFAGLYYYLWTMAKCLDSLGVDSIVDAKGARHDWRAEMAAALVKKQRKDGGWANESGTWMESNPDLVTAYSLLALSSCKKK